MRYIGKSEGVALRWVLSGVVILGRLLMAKHALSNEERKVMSWLGDRFN
jgi:hypothetical protein